MTSARSAHPAPSGQPRSEATAISSDPSTSPSLGRRSETEVDATVAKAFSTSRVVSGIRCLLAYVVFPWILPLLGVAKGMGPAVGLVVGTVAIGFNIASIRRFMRSGHRYRYWIATINIVVIGMLVVLIVRDVADLLG